MIERSRLPGGRNVLFRFAAYRLDRDRRELRRGDVQKLIRTVARKGLRFVGALDAGDGAGIRGFC
jgi:hypothetical protein